MSNEQKQQQTATPTDAASPTVITSRRDFLQGAATAAMAAGALGVLSGCQTGAGGGDKPKVQAPPRITTRAPYGGTRRRYAVIGTGIRGVTMWGKDVHTNYADAVELVGLCDANPLRVEAGRSYIGASCPTFTDFDEMCDKAKPEVLAVTTVDATHSGYIVRALDRGIDVITEKPMVTDEKQCQAVLDAEERNKRKIIVGFNYRYGPRSQQVKELLMSGAIGKLLSVDYNYFLDTSHGADYFRRWHGHRDKSGSLLVHKSTHHFDILNWWLDADPVEVTAKGSLKFYGKNNAFRHTHCRPCPHKGTCKFYTDIMKDKTMVQLYANCESADGYLRDGCVWRESIDIFDTMSALVTYSSGVSLTYSLNAFMPIEGFQVAFNGELGRLDVRAFERQPWKVADDYEIRLTRNFEGSEVIPSIKGGEGHGGADPRLKDLIFLQTPMPTHMKLPGSRAGAMSCLTGIAARKSIDEKRAVKIGDLVKFA